VLTGACGGGCSQLSYGCGRIEADSAVGPGGAVPLVCIQVPGSSRGGAERAAGLSSRTRCAGRRAKVTYTGLECRALYGRPLQRQGRAADAMAQNRAALEHRSLMPPYGPDGEGQARGQAQRARGKPLAQSGCWWLVCTSGSAQGTCSSFRIPPERNHAGSRAYQPAENSSHGKMILTANRCPDVPQPVTERTPFVLLTQVSAHSTKPSSAA
jgi:hypothetical protein